MEKPETDLLIKGIESGRMAFIGPEVVQIDLCGRCNNTCIGCWVHSPYIKDPPPDKDVVLPFDRAAALVSDIASLGTKEVFLSGAGEPFLHPRIRDIIRLIKSKGMRLNIITNGSLLDGENARVVVEAGVDLLTCSVWAGSAAGYCAVHPGKTEKDFATVRRNLAGLAELKARADARAPEVKIYNVITSRNCGEIREMVDLAIELRAQYVEFQAVDTREGETGFLALDDEQARRVREQFDALYSHPGLCFRDLQFSAPRNGELREFGGRFGIVPGGFRMTEYTKDKTLRTLTCPRGVETRPSEKNPVYDRNECSCVFSFPVERCTLCPDHDCPSKTRGGVRVDFVSILGYRSFMRRLESSRESGKNENGVIDSVPCFSGWVYSRVLSTGDVIPCCKAAFKRSMGSIVSSGFKEIWNSSAYQQFREHAMSSPKSDPYFAAIDCYKSCDNVGMNLMLWDMLRRHLERKAEPPEACAPSGVKELPSAPQVRIPAAGFAKGNFNPVHEFGEGVVIDGGKRFGFAEYAFEIGEAREYELWSCYASTASRPVKVQIDGQTINASGLNGTTPGWTVSDAEWFCEGRLRLEKGAHTLRIFTLDPIPHLREFALCRARSTPPLAMASAWLKGLPAFLNSHRDLMGVFHGRAAFTGPFHVQIDLTNDCNNDCIACWCNSPLLEEKRHGPGKRGQTLPFAMARDLLDELAASGTKEIYFSGGGEPFMHPRIMDILEYAKRKGFTCYVNTNFTLVDEERVRRIAELGIDHLTVSTWAATPATYAATHGNKTEQTFTQMMGNLTLLNRIKRVKPLIKLYNVIFTMNYGELHGMVALARETGSESVEFTLVDTIPGKTDKLLLDAAQSARLRSLAQELASRRDARGCVDGVHLFRYDAFLRRISSDSDLVKATYDRSIIDTIPCYVGWCFSRIMPNGDVNGCLKAHRIPVGNLYTRGFWAIWNGGEQRRFRARTRVREKKDRFFRLIGNDPETKEAGCYKSCDDIGRNLHMHERVKSLTPVRMAVLKVASLISSPPDPGRRPGPEQVVVDLTNRCNQRCLACWMYSPLLSVKPDRSWLKQELGWRYVRRLIDDLAAMGTQRIRFTGGGEPLLHPRIMDILAYGKRKGLTTCLTTNLSRGRRVCESLLAAGLDELAVSLWAGDAASYLGTHPGAPEGEFERIMEDVRFICRSRGAPSVTLCHVITPQNHDGLEAMYAAAADAGADSVYFTLVDPLPGTGRLLLTAEQRGRVLEQALEIRQRAGREGSKAPRLEFIEGFIARLTEPGGLTGDYDKRVNAIPCYAGSAFSRILADGSVCPCCRGVKVRMGNITRQRFRRIWESPAYVEFARKARYLPKTDPYFKDIGCMKMCDNLMHNEDMHRRVEEARRCFLR